MPDVHCWYALSCCARPGTAGAAGAGEAAGAKRELPPWLRGQAWAGAGAAGAGPGGGEGVPAAAGAAPGANAEDVQAPGPPAFVTDFAHTAYLSLHACPGVIIFTSACCAWTRMVAAGRAGDRSRTARLHWPAVQCQSQGGCTDTCQLSIKKFYFYRSRLRRQAAYVRAYQEKVRQREAELAARGAGGLPDAKFGKAEPDAKRPRVEGRFAGAAASAAGAAAARTPALVKPEPGAAERMAERAAEPPKAEPATVRTAVHCTVAGPNCRLDMTVSRFCAVLTRAAMAACGSLRLSNMSHARPGDQAEAL